MGVSKPWEMSMLRNQTKMKRAKDFSSRHGNPLDERSDGCAVYAQGLKEKDKA